MPESVQIVTIVLIGTLLFLILAAFVVVSLLLYQRSQYRHQREIGLLKHNYDQELLRANLEIREQTLNTVAREIHDNIGQVLSLLKLSLNTINMNDTHSATMRVRNAGSLAGKAIVDLRNLSRTLNADHIMDQELRVSIRHELEVLQKTGAVCATLQIEGQDKPLSPQKRLIVFRIFQEGLNNAIRHADASRVETILQYGEQSLILILRDNGKGFDVDRHVRGTGLNNMHYRASLIGSFFGVESTIGKGTCIQLKIPFENGSYKDFSGG